MSVIGAAALVGAIAWAMWPAAEEDPIRLAGESSAPTRPGPATAVRPTEPQAAVDPAASPLAPSTTALSATDEPVAPITVTAPQTVRIGSPNELVVSLGENAGVSEISFTVQVDPNVLQVRAGTKGDWAFGPGLSEQFEARIPDAADRADIRSVVSGRRSGGGGGSVAIVQFDAIARGRTSLTLSNVVAKDLSGRPIPSVKPNSTLEMTVD